MRQTEQDISKPYMAWDINGLEVNLHDRKETFCKKDVFLADCRNGTYNDSNHIGRIFSDKIYRSVMGWDGFNSLCNTVDAFYGTTVGNETSIHSHGRLY